MRRVAVLLALMTAPAVAQFETVTVDVKRSPRDKEWKREDTKVLADDATLPAAKLSRFGGNLDEKFESTGFFRTHHRPDGRWTLVDPDGCAFLSIGLNAVNATQTAAANLALKARYGDHDGWTAQTAKLLRDCDFNTLGCWSDYESFTNAKQPIPYCTQLNFMSAYGRQRGGTFQKPGHTGYPDDCIFVFDPQFETFARDLAQRELGPLKNDPFLLGHFSDNELPLWRGALGRYRKLPEGDPGRIAADAWWNERRGESDRRPNDDDEDAFLEFVCDRYYGICAAALKAADPNHLFLGSRLLNASSKSAAVLRGSAKHIDVLSMNYYSAWTPDHATMSSWLRSSGKPFIVTEWYAKGVDSGMPNTTGAGWLVRTQLDRGRFYQNFTLALLAEPGCVGWHWFKYIDNDPTNLAADPSNRDANKGILSCRYESYPPLIHAMTSLNRAAYGLRDALGRKSATSR